jgi:transcriptional regulator with XRE-family HTH domain
MDIPQILAANVRKRRAELGWTQAKLAEELDIHPTFLGQIENCRKFPSTDTLERMVEVLGMRPYELFIEDGIDTEQHSSAELFRAFTNELITEIPKQTEALIMKKAKKYQNKK